MDSFDTGSYFNCHSVTTREKRNPKQASATRLGSIVGYTLKFKA
jgi:hypothetical protein